MTIALSLVLIAVIAALVAGFAERVGWQAPPLLLLVGIVGSYLPFIPEVNLSADTVLFGLLPPLLYAAAIRTSLVDFNRNRAAILSLSVGLILFTALGVALVTTWLIPSVPFGLAFALGAIVAPPDAVAATAVARKVGMPRRIVTILEGESLLNDATALVSLRTGLAIAGLSFGHAAEEAIEEVSVGSVVTDFVWAVIGGLLVGVLVAFFVTKLHRQRVAPEFDTAISFSVPFLAYIAAELQEASGVLAVVVAGLILGHKALETQSASSRLTERINWTSVQFILENAVFLMIGLQLNQIIADGLDDPIGVTRILVTSGAVLLTVILLRPLWIFPQRYLFMRGKSMRMPWRHALLTSWAGMRGVVTLAAAFLLPGNAEHREVLIFIATVVAVGTLFIQGYTLPILARALKVKGPDAREDALQEAVVTQRAVQAGLSALNEHDDAPSEVLERLRSRSDERINRVWERVSPQSLQSIETPSEAYRRIRQEMLEAERAELVTLRDSGDAEHEILAELLNQLDVEESILDTNSRRDDTIVAAEIAAPSALVNTCDHLTIPCQSPVPEKLHCEECDAHNEHPVALRMCEECGYVACCDSSPGRHATAHFRNSGHPVMRSLEPGESWRWCYIDEVNG
ncbi:Na+/H+ antiporter [Ornithinimicrobium sp. Arc0846-15]|nr:Na+/H+ antiporter [Ornithinimicrobium laminariae]